MLFLALAGRWIARTAAGAWRAVSSSKTLQWILAGVIAALVALFTLKRALDKTRQAGRREGREEILDKIERDTKNAVKRIAEAERRIEKEHGPAPVFEDNGDGEGLTTDDLNRRELERLRKRAEDDPRNRGNPRSTPRSDI